MKGVPSVIHKKLLIMFLPSLLRPIQSLRSCKATSTMTSPAFLLARRRIFHYSTSCRFMRRSEFRFPWSTNNSNGSRIDAFRNSSRGIGSPSTVGISAVFVVASAAAAIASTAGTTSGIALCASHEAASSCESDCETNNNVFPDTVLSYDTYGGVTMDVNKLFDIENGSKLLDRSEAFEETLENSLLLWKRQGKRGVWLHIPTSCSHIVPICAKFGFEFQYAKNGLLVMTKWLPEDSGSRLPHGPTHQVGIGAVILHPVTHKMLVVQEKHGPAAARKLWKMPTGLTDPGEDIVDAAVREAKEETGLDVEFDRIICMRQAHGGIFDQSDMFFVCLLHLSQQHKEKLQRGIEIPLIPQEEEIAKIKWMSMDEFAAQDVWQNSPLYKEMNDAMIRVANSVLRESKTSKGTNCLDAEVDDGGQGQCGFVAKNLPIGFMRGSQTVYLSRL
mmetsp:Transcript_6396/g.12059  ORF Transcript_6396/g.12059 Transcript_6396/m.12059 type:complete len:445 (+) Transcript_6396:149-1483(+)